MTRIITTSDFHGNLPVVPECDLLLLAGDMCPAYAPADQAKWLDTHFRKWLEEAPAKEIVGIAGNHDRIFENHPDLVPKGLRWHYLQDSFTTLFGLIIHGTPWQLPFWGSFNLSDGRLTEVYKKIPDNADIIISHGPPFGIHDTIKKPDGGVIHTGSASLKKRILEVKPKLCLFGHIHEAYGTTTESDIIFANVSLVNDELKISHEPMSFELSLSG